MAESLRYPFTVAQWKELERQAMIYKYMMASVPVPPDLLFPLPLRNLSDVCAASHSGGSEDFSTLLNLKFGNGRDPEIGRCRRTDGKKWRCSKDVAPNQKYCERHLHRGRPRSRKHVEQHLKSPRLPTSTNATPNIASPYHHKTSPPFYLPTAVSLASSPYQESRSLVWAVKERAELSKPVRNRQWQSPFCNNGDTNPFSYHQHTPEEEQASSANNPYGDCGEEEHQHQQPKDCSLYLNPNLLSSDRPLLSGTPIRGFIDAWPDKSHSSVSGSTRLPASNLTLSMAMAGGDLVDGEMGLEVADSNKIKGSSGGGSGLGLGWGSPVLSWAACPTPGGPLAEVLRPSSGGVAAVGQIPTGSVSDSSGGSSGSSPTLNASGASVRQGIAFPWFS